MRRETFRSGIIIVCDAHDVLGEGFGDHRKENI